MTDRITKLCAQMKSEGVDLVVLGPSAHLAWLTGMHPHADERPFLLCISASGSAILMPALEAESARKQTDITFFEWSDADGPRDQLAKLLKHINAADAQNVAPHEHKRRACGGKLNRNALDGLRRGGGGVDERRLGVVDGADLDAASPVALYGAKAHLRAPRILSKPAVHLGRREGAEG